MKTVKFILHLFFEDPRIPIGVGMGMLVTYLVHSIIPSGLGNILYLAIIFATLAFSVVKNA